MPPTTPTLLRRRARAAGTPFARRFDMTHDVLGAEDAAWFHMEDETNPMVVNGVLELAERLELARVHDVLAQLARIPRFRSRIVDSSVHVALPHWEELRELDLSQHVEHVTLPSSDDAALREFVGGAVSSLLDRTRPLWHVYVVDRPSCGTTLVFRIHHAIADGFALLGVLLSLCDDGGGHRLTPPAIRRRGGIATTAAFTRSLARITTLPRDPHTELKGPLSRRKNVAWSAPIALADVKTVAHACSATVNDVLVATAAGAIGRYLARRGQDVDGLEIHAMLPVDLRGGAAPTELGNRFGLFILGLPLGIRETSSRIKAVKQRMDLLKGTPEAVVTHALLRALGRAPRPVEALGVWFFGQKSSIVLTNVPGPRTQLRLGGIPVSRIMFWVPQAGRMGVGISIFSYAGNVTIGVMADAGLVPDPNALAAEVDAELAALREAVTRQPSANEKASAAEEEFLAH